MSPAAPYPWTEADVAVADTLAEWIFQSYVKARPTEAVSFADMRDRIRQVVAEVRKAAARAGTPDGLAEARDRERDALAMILFVGLCAGDRLEAAEMIAGGEATEQEWRSQAVIGRLTRALAAAEARASALKAALTVAASRMEVAAMDWSIANATASQKLTHADDMGSWAKQARRALAAQFAAQLADPTQGRDGATIRENRIVADSTPAGATCKPSLQVADPAQGRNGAKRDDPGAKREDLDPAQGRDGACPGLNRASAEQQDAPVSRPGRLASEDARAEATRLPEQSSQGFGHQSRPDGGPIADAAQSKTDASATHAKSASVADPAPLGAREARAAGECRYCGTTPGSGERACCTPAQALRCTWLTGDDRRALTDEENRNGR